jgi:hypothetical protein
MNSRIIENAKLSLATLAFIASVGSLIIGTVAWFASSNYLEWPTSKSPWAKPNRWQSDWWSRW